MAINSKEAPKGGKNIPAMEAGSYPSRLVIIADLGLQPQMFNNEPKEPKREILVTYEHVDEFLKDDAGNDLPDKPRWNSERFALNNLDNKKAKSTQRYDALDPNGVHGGDWKPLLSTPCMVTVVKNPPARPGLREYNKVTAVSAMRAKEAAKCPALVNEALYFDMDDPDIEVFYKLPKFVQEKITSGLQFAGSKLDGLLKANPKQAGAKGAPKPPKQDVNPDAELDDEIPY